MKAAQSMQHEQSGDRHGITATIALRSILQTAAYQHTNTSINSYLIACYIACRAVAIEVMCW
jgi:hypothetical protein